MAMDYFNPAEAFKEGYAATEAVSSDIQSKDILRQAYAGQDANMATPQGDMSVYQKAAKLAGMSGNASLAYSFNKQAAESGKLVASQRALELEDTQGRLALAGQYLKGATDDAGLESAINAAGLPEQAKMQAYAVLKSNLPFEQKQAKLAAMGATIDQDLRAQQIALQGGKTAEELKIKQQRLAETRVQDAYRRGEIPDPNDVRISKGQDASAVGAGIDKKPTSFLEQRASVESRGFEGDTAYSAQSKTSTALGKYGLTEGTYNKMRAKDPSLPEFSKLKGNKSAQDKAAGMLETQITDEITKAGFAPTNENKDLWWKFGDPTAKALLDAKPDVPADWVLSDKVIKANPDLQKKGLTVGDVIKNTISAAAPKETKQNGLSADRQERTQQLEEAYTNAPLNIQKKVAGLAPLGVEYGIEPRKMPTLNSVELKSVEANYEVLKKTEDIAQRLKDNPSAAGTLASLVHKYGAITEQSLNNIQKDKAYTRDVAILGKELLTLALEDAAGASGGRMNQYLEKAFRGVYDQSLSAETLTDLLKTRQADSAKRIENKIIGAKRENLDPEQYKLMSSKGGKEYLGDAKAQQAEEMKNRPPIASFGGPAMSDGSFDQRLQSLGAPRQPGQ